MLYEMITGELPYPHGNVHVTMRTKLNQDPRPPSEVMSGIDPKVEEIIMHAIQRSPRERYTTAKEMLTDLENPSQVVLRDRSRAPGAFLSSSACTSRARILARAVLALVIGTLLFLTLVERPAAPHARWARPAAVPRRRPPADA